MISTCLLISIVSVTGSVKQQLVIENPNTGSIVTYYYDSLEKMLEDTPNLEKEIVKLDRECIDGEE
jgi:hypothetical protein